MRIVLVPGAGGIAAYWNLVAPHLREAGHEVVAVDLPGDDPAAGLVEYAALVVDVIGESRPLLVAQSMGAFTAAMVAARASVAGLVFVNAMIPVPGETPGDWWKNVGHADAMRAAAREGGYTETFDVETYFCHDLPPGMLESLEHRDEVAAAFASPCDFAGWPEVPIHVLAGADDRFFPIAFQRRVTRERLGLDVTPVAGGHLNAMSRPAEVAAAILATVR